MNSKSINSIVVLSSIYLIVSGLSGCAAGGAHNARGEAVTDVVQAFSKGEIRLICETSCSGAWGSARNKAKRLHDAGLWKDLAQEVARIGYEDDLPYYYLGRAAEGESHIDAAITYYRLALASRMKCAGLFNNCDGYVFPRDINARLSPLLASAESEKKIVKASDVQIDSKKEANPNSATSSEPPAKTQQVVQPVTVTLNSVDPEQESIARKIEVKYDEFKKHTTYVGPEHKRALIRAWMSDGDKEAIYQVYVADYYYGDWRFYHSAYDDDGKQLDLTQISRDVGSCSRYGGCSHYEHIGVTVDRKYLESRKDRGLRFKVSGKAGEEVFELPSKYVKAFISVVPSHAQKVSKVNNLDLPKKSSGDGVDNRTPEERYIGAFEGARLLCGASYLLSKQVKELKSRGVDVDADTEKKSDISGCIKRQISEMEVEYKKYSSLQKSKAARDALTEHYVAAVLAVKSLSPHLGDDDEKYKIRQLENKRKADEKWVRFEMVK